MSRPSVYWRWVLCDSTGIQIAVISSAMENTALTMQLNRPGQLTFDVPSDHRFFNTTYANDGYDEPYLTPGIRVVKGYRKVGDDPGGWELKYIGRVWTIEDNGDGNTTRTSVTCYDSLYELQARMCRNHLGVFDGGPNGVTTISFWGAPAGVETYSSVIRTLINRTNTYGLKPTTIRTTGTWGTTAGVTVQYEAAKILPSIITLTDTGLVDLDVTYPDADPLIDPKYFMQLGAKAQLGDDKPGIIFGYGGPPRNTSGFTRTESLDTLANDITMRGKSVKGKGVSHHSMASANKYGAFEDFSVQSDILTKQLLSDLVIEQVALRKKPRELVNVLPMAELAGSPWDDWYLGDRVKVVVGTDRDNVARRVSRGVQRIYGFTVGMESNFSEHVTNMVMSSSAETS